ncbi:DUF4386 domain-containing protein [Nonomuraea sp. NBC_01738]|uniref:DUF4386 domain-containing protein n=1 Tax=Nonomuraea sp. NBC_01738 TaxID=2976003 RepID=UPI002E0D64DF|nr:DUF4386 domain-containing protein [Nonomuraea sp. NBC_01738]
MDDIAPRRLARIAGLLYLLVAGFTIFAGAVNASIVVPGDAAATAGNIGESAALFRIGFVAELVGATAFLLTGMALFVLLRHVNTLVAGAMVTFVVVGVTIQSLNLLNQKAALMIATGRAEAGGLTMLFADLQRDGYLISQIYFGLWLLPLGYLVIKSGYFPKPLGFLLVIGCCSHLVDVFIRFLAPDLAANTSQVALIPAAVAELSFIAWLLVKAVRAPGPAIA